MIGSRHRAIAADGRDCGTASGSPTCQGTDSRVVPMRVATLRCAAARLRGRCRTAVIGLPVIAASLVKSLGSSWSAAAAASLCATALMLPLALALCLASGALDTRAALEASEQELGVRSVSPLEILG